MSILGTVATIVTSLIATALWEGGKGIYIYQKTEVEHYCIGRMQSEHLTEYFDMILEYQKCLRKNR